MQQRETTNLSSSLICISKIANELPNNSDVIMQEKQYAVIKKPTVIFTTIGLFLDQDIIYDESVITCFDMAVCESVFGLYRMGINDFSLEEIARVLSGNPEKKGSQKLCLQIDASISKLRHTDIKIDCTDEYIARKLISKKDYVPQKRGSSIYKPKYILKGYLLPLECLEITDGNGNLCKKTYHLIKEPVLYQYCSDIHQITQIPWEYFNACKSLSDTMEVILIKRYIFRRILGMRNRRNNLFSLKISYQWYDATTHKDKGLYSVLGYKPDQYANWRKKRSDVHKIVKAVLECLKQSGLITDYMEYESNRHIITGCNISFNDETIGRLSESDYQRNTVIQSEKTVTHLEKPVTPPEKSVTSPEKSVTRVKPKNPTKPATIRAPAIVSS